ncbi:hypothetical protein [Methylomonas sp. HYX-M1]|uniref:hypothetical protein n=1 Tax=Methylomonas sp. HYX-M1 TaxID=3139307 RepID=UPI00345BB265
MTILANDIKLLKSEVMYDVPEGGGGVTGQVVVDGESNNMFDDVSTLDRVYGAVHVRKIFGAVQTANKDKYYGAHAIISKLPGDAKLGVNLFSTADWFDRRPDATGRVQNYRAQGPLYNGFLWGTQYQGSRAVTIFQGVTAPLPGIGDVLMLVTAAGSQYIRIVNFSHSQQEFTDDKGAYNRRVIELEISDVLTRDFVGAQMSRLDNLSPAATVFKTVIANAARYYSARPLALAAQLGDSEVKVDTVYSQVVPASQAEKVLVDQAAAAIVTPLIDAGQANTGFSTSTTWAAGGYVYLGAPCLPGSLTVTGGAALTDSAGKIKSGETVVGSIDYEQGVIAFSAVAPSYAGNKTVSFRPAAAPSNSGDTASIKVTAANRGYVYTLILIPAAKPRALTVRYRALGKWYALTDNGAGALVADEPGVGSGTVNYGTGSVSITAAAYPDVDTDIIFTWSQSTDYFNRSGNVPGKAGFSIELPDADKGLAPETLVIYWNDGTARTATCNAAGVISGDAAGNVDLAAGEIAFSPNLLPAAGVVFNFAYAVATRHVKTLPAAATAGTVDTLNVADTNLYPGSVRVEWQAPWSADAGLIVPVGSGSVRRWRVDNGAGDWTVGGGGIDYATGVLTVDYAGSVPYLAAQFGRGTDYPTEPWSKIVRGVTYTNNVNGAQVTGYSSHTAEQGAPAQYTVTYRTLAATNGSAAALTASALIVDLALAGGEAVIPGSVLFSLGGRTYFDRNGQLYYGIDRSSGVATLAGTVDYASGRCLISQWPAGQSAEVSLIGLATHYAYHPVESVTFSVAAAPVKVGVFQVRATPVDGGSDLLASADSQGVIDTGDVWGYIDYETGVVKVRFGDMVDAAGNQTKPWYVAENVVDSKIWKPRLVYAESVVYTTVSYTYLPLSAAILGLDPVRLPADGRVPVYQPGDVVVVLNDQTTVGTFTSGATTDLGRVRIAKLTVRDLGGNPLPVEKYTADLDAGTVVWGDLSGVSQPLTIVDRIEDMAVLTDVQITGQLALSQPLSHDFPADNTLVANAVIWGTLYARTSTPFDQQTWTNVWSDSLIGSSVAAQYNHGQYPIAVDNLSAIQERWSVIFTGATTFNVIGEHVGQIIGGNTSVDCAPVNPNTGLPYFIISYLGWGSGWSAGNVLRFNTYAANAPVWVIQAVAQGAATDDDYTMCIEVRGDIDTP